MSSYHSRPLYAIFTTSGWPLLTHHGRPLSQTGFSSRVKNDNRPEGCEMSHRNGWYPRCLLSSAFAHLWHRTRSEGKRYSPSEEGRNANKNARKKGGRGRHYALLAGPLIIMAVRLSVPTLTLIRPNEHRARARNICIIAAILMPFDAECIWSFTRGLFPSLSESLRFHMFSLSSHKMSFTSATF